MWQNKNANIGLGLRRRPKPRFDLTLNGQPLREEREPKYPMYTGPGRGFNNHHMKYIDIRELLQGSYSPSWRLETSRSLSSLHDPDKLEPRHEDVIRDFLVKSADPRISEKSKTKVSPEARPKDSKQNSVPPTRAPLKREGTDITKQSLQHQALEDEYRAIRDLTRGSPRYTSVSYSNRQYINFVNAKPLHRPKSPDGDQSEDSDSGGDSDVSNAREAVGLISANVSQADEVASAEATADILVVNNEYEPSLSPIAETIPSTADVEREERLRELEAMGITSYLDDYGGKKKQESYNEETNKRAVDADSMSVTEEHRPATEHISINIQEYMDGSEDVDEECEEDGRRSTEGSHYDGDYEDEIEQE